MTFLTFASPSFQSRANVLIESIKKCHPNASIVCEEPPATPIGTYVAGLAKHRLIRALEILEGGEELVVIIGADCEIFQPLKELEGEYSIAIVPHVKFPLTDRTYMAQIYRTGHANADLIGIKNNSEGKKILQWLISVTEGNEPGLGVFYEQTWLSATPFLFDNVKIIRDLGYNNGYWDVDVVDLDNIKMFQYSGYVKGAPERMSRYSKSLATGRILDFYRAYDERINE